MRAKAPPSTVNRIFEFRLSCSFVYRFEKRKYTIESFSGKFSNSLLGRSLRIICLSSVAEGKKKVCEEKLIKSCKIAWFARWNLFLPFPPFYADIGYRICQIMGTQKGKWAAEAKKKNKIESTNLCRMLLRNDMWIYGNNNEILTNNFFFLANPELLRSYKWKCRFCVPNEVWRKKKLKQNRFPRLMFNK